MGGALSMGIQCGDLSAVWGGWGSPGGKPHRHPVGKRNELVCCSPGCSFTG
jgi:hypothetical protein